MNKTDSEELTRVGEGTVMGDFMRQYWVPAAMSGELQVDAPPMRLMLLGEKLIAFRDSLGRVGVMDHRCPHRCASLFLGRNEQAGVRCIYHGWKFDVDGNCLEMPNMPANPQVQSKIKAKAYKVRERGGLVWVYMGDRTEPPPLPMIEAAMLPEDEVQITFTLRYCNWLQSLDGELDTSHVGFLHWGCLDPDDVPEGHPLDHLTERVPEYLVREMPWGMHYSSYRPTRGGSQTYWRSSNFMFPFWSQTPQGEFATNVNARAWVPVDDGHTMFIYLRWRRRPGYQVPLKGGKIPGGNRPEPEFLPNTTDWLGRWRLKGQYGNDWLIDRQAQSEGRIFSGIDNIHLQDQAVTESMGPVVDHTLEHLGPGDRMIVRTRLRLLAAARAFRERRETPPGLDAPEVFFGARAGYFLTDSQATWEAAYADQVDRAVRPVALTAAPGVGTLGA